MPEANSLFPPLGPGTAPVESEFDQVERAARRRLMIICGVIIGVLLAAVVLVCGVFGKKDPGTAVVGNCMSGIMETLQVEDCSSSGAHLIVVGRLTVAGEPSDPTLGQDCAPWPSTLFGYYDPRNHVVLCIASRGR